MYSFTNWKGVSREIDFVGFSNYKRLFSDQVFAIAIKNTLIICCSVVVLQNASGLFFAIALNNKRIRGRNFFRTIFYLPCLLSTIVMGNTWLYLLNVHAGVLGMILRRFGVEQVIRFDVFIKPATALATIVFTMIWQFSGFIMMIYLAGLQSIPTELYEAANMDGARPWRKFRSITLPLLMPAVTLSTFLLLTGSLRAFDQVYVLTGGGPGNATETIGTFIYNSAFSGLQLGYGTAIATVLFVGILVVSIFQLRFSRSIEVEL